jgi:hypothetical protein
MLEELIAPKPVEIDYRLVGRYENMRSYIN